MLSMGVLLLWSYLFPPPKTDDNANANSNSAVVVPENQTAATNAPQTQTLPLAQNVQPDAVPARGVTVKTPFYDVKLDSRGAVATSWILRKSKAGDLEKPLTSIASTKDDPLPLELVSPEGARRRELPLKLQTGDQNLDAILNDRNYQIAGADADEIVLNAGETKKIDFVLRDDANQIEAVKSLTFNGDGYVSELNATVKRNNQIVPNVRLLIGASIGDQGVKHYTLYQIEPEAVAEMADGRTERHRGTEFFAKNNGRMTVGGAVNWGGMGDTYFAMAAIPARPLEGLELQAVAYDVPVEPHYGGIFNFITQTKIDKETRHLVSAYVPITADGAPTKIYTGTKDHFALTTIGGELSQTIGRAVDLDKFINYYGWLSFLVRPLTQPILGALRILSGFTHNYGVSILLFTVLFYSLLFPMRWYQSRSFKKAAKNAPKMKELQERMKEYQAKKIPLEDPRMRELQMEQLKLTKDAVPIGGCLPLLLQMPLLFAMLAAITISLDFRQASFLWLPDLSAADPYHFLEFAFAGSMALSMLFTPTAPAMTDEQRMQQKMMTYFMPVMMLWVMWSAPSGLLVYWLTGNIIGFCQQMLINRLNKRNDEPPTATTGNNPTMTKKQMKTSLSPS